MDRNVDCLGPSHDLNKNVTCVPGQKRRPTSGLHTRPGANPPTDHSLASVLAVGVGLTTKPQSTGLCEGRSLAVAPLASLGRAGLRWLTRMLAVAITLASSPAWAHKPSDAHLQIAVTDDRFTGSLAVAARDLDGALDVDFDGNGDITWNEVTTAAPRIAAYETERLSITADGSPCTYALGPGSLVDFSDGAYWTVSITGTCPAAPDTLTVRYKLLFDIDAQHRGIVSVSTATMRKTSVARDGTPIAVDLEPTSAIRFVGNGIAAIATSPLHLFFLVCLVLPAVLVRRRPASSLREVIPETAATIAGLAIATLATFMLAASGLVGLPAWLVEVAVAGSIIVVAALNLLRADESRWDFVFELGLVQGLGFAVSLGQLGAPVTHIGPTLGFAVGIVLAEAGIVAAILPALFAMRRTLVYQTLLWGGSAIALLFGAIWTLQAWTST